MYELNTMFAGTDRSRFDEDCNVGRGFYVSHGAMDVLLCELISGTNAGTFAWSARFETLDDVAKYLRFAVAAAQGRGETEPGEVRSRYTVIARNISRVFSEAGERRGPCMAVSKFVADKPFTDSNQAAMDGAIAAGATGVATNVVVDGPEIGNYYGAVFGDTFEQIDASATASMANEEIVAMIAECGVRRVDRWLFDVS